MVSHNLTWQSVGYFPSAPTPVERYFVWYAENKRSMSAAYVYRDANTPFATWFHPIEGFNTQAEAQEWIRLRALQKYCDVSEYSIHHTHTHEDE